MQVESSACSRRHVRDHLFPECAALTSDSGTFLLVNQIDQYRQSA
jgi:hypothetical protein